MQLTHLSLFSGGGGGDLACKWAGFETLAFVEKDEYCQKLLNQNYPGIPVYGDIFEFSAEPFRGVTLVTGGFPCQPFSQAGKRKGASDDRYLWPEMLRVIRQCEPTWVIGENVAGLINMLEFERVCASLEEEGYGVQALVIPACAVNASHRRDRVFIVAHSANTRLAGRERIEGDDARDGRTRRDGSGDGGGDARGQAMADANRLGCMEGELEIYAAETREFSQSGSTERGQAICDSASERLPEWAGGAMGQPSPLTEFERSGSDGKEREVERDFRGVAYGVSNRVDRIKIAGNSIVPQQWYPIIQGIADIERSLWEAS